VTYQVLLGLLTLALFFLNFGHSAYAFAPDGHAPVSATSVCGDPLTPMDGDHAPCHACRIGNGADLPAPPLDAVPVAFAVAPVVYAAPVAGLEATPLLIIARSRAPPTI
jgi:hypothetical protein